MTLYQILVVQPKNYVKILFGHIEMLSKKNWFKKRFLMVNSSVLKKNWLGLTQEEYRSPPPAQKIIGLNCVWLLLELLGEVACKI